jgi:hypothetical protein
MPGPSPASTPSRWLKRLRRELSGSGRVAQFALQLAAADDTPAKQWEHDLRSILSGEQSPEASTILRIEKLIARPKPEPVPSSQQMLAF